MAFTVGGADEAGLLVTQTPAPDQLPPMPPMPVDPNYLVSQIIPLIGGLAAMVLFALVARWFFHSPIAESIAEACPKAFILVISNPVNSTVPVFAEVLKKKGVFDPKR